MDPRYPRHPRYLADSLFQAGNQRHQTLLQKRTKRKQEINAIATGINTSKSL